MLFLIGVDPLRDYPDAALARRALENVPRKVVQSLELGSLAPYADAFLPAAAFLEKEGHVTTWEGRGQRIRRGPRRRRASPARLGDLREPRARVGGDLGFETLEELHDEMGRLLAPRGAASARRGRRRRRAELAVEEGELMLFTYPLLVDEGRLSERADELKAALEDEPFVEIHPERRRGGRPRRRGRAIVTTAAGEAELPVRVTEHVSRGSVFVPFNQAGFAREHAPAGSFSIAATLESVDAPRGRPPTRSRSPREVRPDGLARLAAARRAGRASCSSCC